MKHLLIFILSLASLTASAQYLSRDSIARNEAFQSRVRIAMLEAASEILANPADSLSFGYAGRILLEPKSTYFINQFTYAVLTNPVINGNSSDNDIKFTVNTQFAKLALAWRRERGELEEGEQ